MSAQSKRGSIKELYIVSSALLPSSYLKCYKQLINKFTRNITDIFVPLAIVLKSDP